MPSFDNGRLVSWTAEILCCGGMSLDQAEVVADLLVAGDRLGHDTHGLALLPRYHEALATGSMRGSGDPIVLADRGAVCLWDGQRLSGLWLVRQALELASARAREFGVAAVAIRRSHHTACLQAFLPSIVARGQIPIIMLTDPSDRAVAPFGGVEPVLSSDPLAVGLPATDGPILIDMSTSIATNAAVKRRAGIGQRLDGPWLQDFAGRPSDDPAVLAGDRPGSLLPLGGHEYGQKGTSLALMVEGLSQGLAGHGRADGITEWGASVFVQVLDPACFAGADAFTAQTGFIAERIRSSESIPGGSAVRVPGDGAMRRAAEASRFGVPISSAIESELKRLESTVGVRMPEPMIS